MEPSVGWQGGMGYYMDKAFYFESQTVLKS